VKERAGGCTGIMKNPRRIFPPFWFFMKRAGCGDAWAAAPWLLDSIVALAQSRVKGRKS
jgi:hypothetical protein